MQRDIMDYESKYIKGICGFEKYKVIYRRRKIIEIIDKYEPQKILEIGCGMEPLFRYVKDKEFTIVEPCDYFYENAKSASIDEGHITCIKGFFEEVAENLDGGV